MPHERNPGEGPPRKREPLLARPIEINLEPETCPPSRSLARRILELACKRKPLLVAVPLALLVSAAVAQHFLRNFESSESSGAFEAKQAAATKNLPQAPGRPPLVLPEPTTDRDRGPAESLPAGDRVLVTRDAAPPRWEPTTPDEVALSGILSAKARESLARALDPRTTTRGDIQAESSRPVPRDALAALAALGRTEDLRAILSQRTMSLRGARPDSPEANRDGRRSNLPPLADTPRAASPDILAPPLGATKQQASLRRPVEAELLAVLFPSAEAEQTADTWGSTIGNPSEPAILQLVALKRLTESSAQEAEAVLTGLSASVAKSGISEPGALELLIANVYASLVRRDSVNTRYALAAELLEEPAATRRLLVLEAVAAYGTASHQGLLVLAQADPEPKIRTRATEILALKQ